MVRLLCLMFAITTLTACSNDVVNNGAPWSLDDDAVGDTNGEDGEPADTPQKGARQHRTPL